MTDGVFSSTIELGDPKLTYCSWMRESNIDWIIQGPACAVLIINLVFLVRIMWVSRSANKSLVNLLTNHLSLVGAHNETSICQHSWNANSSQGVKSSSRTYSTPGLDIFSCNRRSQRRSRKSHFCNIARHSSQYSRLVRFNVLLLPQQWGQASTQTSLQSPKGHS